MPIPLASHSNSKGLPKSGSWSRGALVSFSLRRLKAFSYAGPQWKGAPFFVNSFNGATMVLNSWTKYL